MELFSLGDSLEEQLEALLEATRDYSSSSHPLSHSPPPQSRAPFIGELLSGSFHLVRPSIEAFDAAAAAAESAKAAQEDLERAERQAELAKTARESEEREEGVEGKEEAAGGAPSDEFGATAIAALAEAARTAAEARMEAEGVAEERARGLPLWLHVGLLKACHAYEAWDLVDALLSSTRRRCEAAENALSDQMAEQTGRGEEEKATKNISPRGGGATLSPRGLGGSLSPRGGGGGLSPRGTVLSTLMEGGPPTPLDEEAEATAVMYTETELIAIGRQIEMVGRASSNKRTCPPPPLPTSLHPSAHLPLLLPPSASRFHFHHLIHRLPPSHHLS